MLRTCGSCSRRESLEHDEDFVETCWTDLVFCRLLARMDVLVTHCRSKSIEACSLSFEF